MCKCQCEADKNFCVFWDPVLEGVEPDIWNFKIYIDHTIIGYLVDWLLMQVFFILYILISQKIIIIQQLLEEVVLYRIIRDLTLN